jgi:LDH2 family malate/lactate/ureidoglycolate dehydrogenase
MAEAIKRAEKTGAGFVAVRNSNHFGAAGVYATMALEHDMIGIVMTNGPMTTVVSPVSIKSAVDTNPIAIAAPAGEKPPFVLDMATSVVANGRVGLAAREGKTIPVGWAIDKDGKPLTDPTKRVFGEGGVLPLGGTPEFGGFKGFGLAVMVEILCGLLSGSSAAIIKEKRPEAERSTDHFFGALRIDSFLPVETFKKSMDDMIAGFEALPPIPGVKKLYAPGGYEAEVEKERMVKGIPLHPSVEQSLRDLAKDVGIDYNL